MPISEGVSHSLCSVVRSQENRYLAAASVLRSWDLGRDRQDSQIGLQLGCASTYASQSTDSEGCFSSGRRPTGLSLKTDKFSSLVPVCKVESDPGGLLRQAVLTLNKLTGVSGAPVCFSCSYLVQEAAFMLGSCINY